MKKVLLVTIMACVVFLFCACGNTNTVASVTPTPLHTLPPVHTSTPLPQSPIRTPILLEPKQSDGYQGDGKLHVYIVGEGEKLLTPESSFINYIIYYPESKHMIINMSGKDYVYANISSSFWDDFTDSTSKDNFYNDRVRNHPEYYVNDYVSGRGDDIKIDYTNHSIKLIESKPVTEIPSYNTSYAYYPQYAYCVECGVLGSTDDLYYSEYEDVYLCEDCLFGGCDYDICDGCGEIFHVDDLYDSYCESCWDVIREESGEDW